jgi:hypothetical protein
MDDTAPPPSDELVLALIVHLLRQGVIDQDGVAEMAAGVSDDAAHLVNCAVVEASAPKESDWRAERARCGFRVVEGGGE